MKNRRAPTSKLASGRAAPSAPECGTTDRITARKNGFYRCNPCKLVSPFRTGTIFGRSHVPLHKWLYAMYLLALTREPISFAAALQANQDHAENQRGTCCNGCARRAAQSTRCSAGERETVNCSSGAPVHENSYLSSNNKEDE